MPLHQGVWDRAEEALRQAEARPQRLIAGSLNSRRNHGGSGDRGLPARLFLHQ
jgi:hypothetical protein